jgi:hypothetical protein
MARRKLTSTSPRVDPLHNNCTGVAIGRVGAWITTPTFADLGISKSQSSRWQPLARLGDTYGRHGYSTAEEDAELVRLANSGVSRIEITVHLYRPLKARTK